MFHGWSRLAISYEAATSAGRSENLQCGGKGKCDSRALASAYTDGIVNPNNIRD